VTAAPLAYRGRPVVVGAGVAGLMTALELAPRPVVVLSNGPLGEEGSTLWAQGGMAAALGRDDRPALHAADTIAAGDGLCEAAIVDRFARAAPEAIAKLARLGVRFDHKPDGGFALGLEAAHSRSRIAHVGGDGAPPRGRWAPRADPTPIRPILSRAAGVARDGETLAAAIGPLVEMAASNQPAADPAAVALMIAVAALRREHSLGAHYRTDFPLAPPAPVRSRLTLDEAFRRGRPLCRTCLHPESLTHAACAAARDSHRAHRPRGAS
jgi:aspartate oxidase